MLRHRLGMVGGLVIFASLLAGWFVVEPSLAQEGGVDYVDVSPGSSHFEEIAFLAGMGVFAGTDCGEGRFCPDGELSRRTFAVWLVRVLDDGADPAPGLFSFGDVADTDSEAPFVARLAELGITRGCSADPPLFCPDRSVSREQMASFLVRAFELPAADAAGFTDVVVGGTHAEAIGRLAAVGVTRGCSAQPPRFCPGQDVTRAQMASFLARAIRWRQSFSAVTEHDGGLPGVPLDFNVTVHSSNETVLTADSRLVPYSSYDAVLTWRESPPGANHFSVQWRRLEADYHPFDEYVPTYLTISGEAPNRVFTWELGLNQHMVIVRVVAHNDYGSNPSDEVFIPTPNNELWVTLKELVVDVYEDDYLWIREVWAFMNNGRYFPSGVRVVPDEWLPRNIRHPDAMLVRSPNVNTPFNVFGMTVPVKTVALGEDAVGIYLRQMAHIYVLDERATIQLAGPVGVASVYMQKLASDSGRTYCYAHEIYADTIEDLRLQETFQERHFSLYWSHCGYGRVTP